MRRSRETEFLTNDDGTLVGIMMKADFTAEHEWGIKDLARVLDFDPKAHGIKGRQVRSTEDVKYFNGKKGDYLMVCSHWSDDEKTIAWLDKHQELHSSHQPENMSSAWSGGVFCVCAKSEEDACKLNEIFRAFHKKDVALWVGGASPNPFDRGGLVVAIVSRLPKEVTQQLYDFDKDQAALKKEDEQYQFEKQLRAKPDLSYCSARPVWTKECVGKYERNGATIDQRTTHKVVYHINGHYVYGCFTVEEIQEFLKTATGAIFEDIHERRSRK